jgi:hypothetical protein
VFEPSVTWATEHLQDAYEHMDAFVCASKAGRPMLLHLECTAVTAHVDPADQHRSLAAVIEPEAWCQAAHTALTRTPAFASKYGAGVYIHGPVEPGMHAAVVGGIPFGTSWVTAEEAARATAAPKWPVASIIASYKHYLPGHKLRHEVIAWARGAGRARTGAEFAAAAPATAPTQDVVVYETALGRLPRKVDGHAPFMYSIVIENTSTPSWWSEKLVDCVSCRSVALYWGAADVHKWFDAGSVLTWRTLEELQVLLGRMSDADYASRAAALEDNARRVRVYRSGFSLLFLHSALPSLPNLQLAGGRAVGCSLCDAVFEAAPS